MNNIIIERSDAQKAARIDALRAELKGLGYSVVLTTYLAALAYQAKRLRTLEASQS